MTSVRILIWNCTGGIVRKLGHVTDPLPDIAILSEVGVECVELFGRPQNVAWVKEKG